jgi:DNA-binding response OmpR family regulator/drug/metabolite transporter (DMT)-like permease
MTLRHDKPVVLIVDDTAFNRKKLSAALTNLGLEAVLAEDGQAGLDQMHRRAFDLILLDIVMPGKDGFDVLGEVRGDANLRETPILVISAVEQTDEIARALDLGAIDFLPKSVAPQIFRARVLGAIEKKRMRDLELSYFHDVARLTSAARLIRAGQTDPRTLDLDPVAQRPDGLGNLAQVFADLATSVHKREQLARQRINLLQGSLLLLIMGLSWGAVPALSKILVGPTPLDPLGIAAWVALVTLTLVTCVLAAQGIWPKFTRAKLRFGLIAGLFAGVLPQVALFWVSNHIPGVAISIMLALESLFVFSIAAALRIEKPSAVRLFGLMFGLLAVLIVMFGKGQAEGLGPSLWMLAALVVPLSYAVEGILVASMPEDSTTTPFELLFFMMLGSSFWGWSGASLSGSVLNPLTAAPSTLALIATIGSMSAIANGCYVLTIRKMGAVFASQYAYFATVLGVGWSILLLNERLTLWVCSALGCVIIGMFLVRPKDGPRSLAPLDLPPVQDQWGGSGLGQITRLDKLDI